MKSKAYIGNILNPISDKRCDFYRRGVLIIRNKKIVDVGNISLLKMHSDCEILDLGEQLIMPGFYDMHFHWVQDDVCNMPKDSLLEWLKKYTFVAEAKFKNIKYSEKKAKHFFAKILKHGTIGGGCYSSIHGHALDHAFNYAQGDFIIGNVLMTMNSPEKLLQSKTEALTLVKEKAALYKNRYGMTPRFAIATDSETMKEGASIAKRNKSFIQTHLSENHDEIAFVKSIYQNQKGFENIKSYTDIYDRCNILSEKTIMGHGIHLDSKELKRLAETKTTIAHCPTSNAPIAELGLGSGLFDFKKIEKAKIRWALASDIGGGPFLSMFDVMRSFVEQNKKAKKTGATFVKALFRSTMSGCEILQLAKKKGNFLPGKEANFIVVTPIKWQQNKKYSAEEVLGKLILPQRKNRSAYSKLVNEVYLKGDKVFPKHH